MTTIDDAPAPTGAVDTRRLRVFRFTRGGDESHFDVFDGVPVEPGTTVLEARDVMCALIDAGDLADLDETRRLQELLTRQTA